MSVSAAQQRVLRAEQAIAVAQAELAAAKAARDIELAAVGWLKLPAVGRDDLYENPTHFANPMLSISSVIELVTQQEATAA